MTGEVKLVCSARGSVDSRAAPLLTRSRAWIECNVEGERKLYGRLAVECR